MTPGKIQIKPEGLTIKFDSKKFAKGLGEVGSEIFDFKFGSALKSARKAFNVETPVEGVAFSIIWAALQDGVAKIFSDSRFREYFDNLEDAVEKHRKIKAQFYDLLAEGDYEIGKDFFSAPQELDFVKSAKEILKKWLQEEHGYSEMAAFNLSQTLPLQFLRCLVETDKEAIDKIKEGVKSEFAEAFASILRKESYHAKLLEEFSRPAFNDPKVLFSEMYVEPNFFIHEESISDKEMETKNYAKQEGNDDKYPYYKKKHYRKNIHGFFLEWLDGNKKLNLHAEDSQLLILLGQPGQGKTSFCQRTIHQLLNEGHNVIENLHFVKLRNIVKPQQLIADPMDYLRSEINNICFDSDKPLDRIFLKDGLLILDGLDELYMSQGLTQDQICDFVTKLKEQVEKQKDNWNLKVLITSRLNYLDLNKFKAKETLVIKLAELSELQQKEWLTKYKKHYPKAILTLEKLKEINAGSDEKHKDLKKLINQPILLQLIADADFDIDLQTNRSKIYEKLFDTIINRRWSTDGQLKMFKGLQEEKGKRQFIKFLRTLALEVFQSDHEYVTRKQFIKEGTLKKSVERLKKTLNQSDLPTKELVKNLLVSFYFQEINRDKKEKAADEDHDFYAYEFLHKSLMEYLAAERIWDVFKSFLEKDSEGDYRIEDWQDVLKVITTLFAPKIISTEIADYLWELIQNENEALQSEIFSYLKKVFTPLLNRGFLNEYQANINFDAPMKISLACFYGFWSVISSSIVPIIPDASNENFKKEFLNNIEKWSIINSENIKKFSNILTLFGKTNPDKSLMLFCQDLTGIDLNGANLVGIQLSGSSLIGANLRRADLFGADFAGANLYKVNLSGADLRTSYLSGASFQKAYLGKADLSDANAQGTDFQDAIFLGTYLLKTDFDNANLNKAKIIGYSIGLETANLKGTIYEGKFDTTWDD